MNFHFHSFVHLGGGGGGGPSFDSDVSNHCSLNIEYCVSTYLLSYRDCFLLKISVFLFFQNYFLKLSLFLCFSSLTKFSIRYLPILLHLKTGFWFLILDFATVVADRRNGNWNRLYGIWPTNLTLGLGLTICSVSNFPSCYFRDLHQGVRFSPPSWNNFHVIMESVVLYI